KPWLPCGSTRSGRNDPGGEQTWRPEHYEISASSKHCPARSRSQDRRGKPTHTLLGKADDTVEETFPSRPADWRPSFRGNRGSQSDHLVFAYPLAFTVSPDQPALPFRANN